MNHKHKWTRARIGLDVTPGVVDTGDGGMMFLEICACGARREERYEYAGRGTSYRRILRPGQPGHRLWGLLAPRKGVARG
jgi:hypothetical protein